MSVIFPDFSQPPPPCRHFSSTICHQFWPIFDPSHLTITDVVYGRPPVYEFLRKHNPQGISPVRARTVYGRVRPAKKHWIFVVNRSFNNYVDQILPYFDPIFLELTIVDISHDTYVLPFVTWPSMEFLLTPSPSLLVYLVIEWPLSTFMLNR